MVERCFIVFNTLHSMVVVNVINREETKLMTFLLAMLWI